MQAKHTPGPWTQEADGSLVIGGQVVATAAHLAPDGASREEQQANAQLIAAAPDMLEALIGALDFMEPSTMSPEAGRARAAVRLAITRAAAQGGRA